MSNQLTIKGGGLSQAQILTLITANAAPLVHASRHQDAGADELTVQGLAGSFRIGYKRVTRDMGLVDGNISYTGLGFRPSSLFIISAAANGNGLSYGYYKAGLEFCIFQEGAGVTFYSQADFVILLTSQTPSYYYGHVISLDADGFTIEWSHAYTVAGDEVDAAFIAFY